MCLGAANEMGKKAGPLAAASVRTVTAGGTVVLVDAAGDGAGPAPPAADPADALAAIGSIRLDNSTAQIGSVMNYITVLVPPDKQDAAKTDAGSYITGLTTKAATLAAKEKLNYLQSMERNGPSEDLSKSQLLTLRRYRRWPCIALAVAILAAVVTLVVVYLTVLRHDPDGLVRLPDGLLLADRELWGARPPRRKMPFLFTPAQYVVVHHTATAQCLYLDDCAGLVRAFQNYHQDPRPQGRGWADIGYNFLVGGDGVVYAGRGWDDVGGHFENTVWNQTMNIALIGNYVDALPPRGQREQLRKFIEWGVKMGKIRHDYQLLGACQILNTQSPGLRLMDDLRSWTHWWNHLDKPEYCAK